MADSEENFEVEEIVNHRFRKGKIQYLIRWKNYTPEDDTWEPKENLECPEKIEAYNKKVYQGFNSMFLSKFKNFLK